MKKYCMWIGAVILLGIAFCFLTGEPNSPNKTFTPPQWKVGDWWKVKLYRTVYYRSGTPPTVCREPEHADDIGFEVKAIKEYEKEQCFEVEIRCLGKKDIYEGHIFVCYFRQENYVCKEVLRIPIKGGELGKPTKVYSQPELKFVSNYGDFRSLYLAINIPRFPDSNIDEARNVWQREDGKETITQKIEFEGPKAMVEFSLSRLKEEHPRIAKCTQVWETGKPWWSESRETELIWKETSAEEEGKYVEHEYSFAELIDWKGKQK